MHNDKLYKVCGKQRDDRIDVLLINVEYRWDNIVPGPNLGLLSIATVVRDAGYSVVYYDTQLSGFNLEVFRRDLAELKPAVVGLSINSDSVFSAQRMVTVIREELPGAKIMAGGPHATARPQMVLLELELDFVVRGEGEDTMVELLELLLSGKGQGEAIRGIVYRQAGSIVTNPRRLFIDDLDRLPIPDRNILVDYRGYSGNLISGRGCPHQCAFCFEGSAGMTYRCRSADRTMEEIRILVDECGYKYFSFADDTFTVDRQRVLDVCTMIREQYGDNQPFGWYSEGRVDVLERYPELLPAMVQAGLIRIQLGVETGNQHILDLYEKKITLQQITSVVEQCVQADVLSIFVNFIIGGPFETRQTVKASTDFALQLCELAPGRIECYSTYLTPFPGTKIYRQPERYGLVPLDKHLHNAESMSYPFFATEQMSKWDIMNAKLEFDTAVSSKMEEMVADLPKDLIDRHHFAHRLGMRSLWTPFFESRRGIARYYATLKSERFRGFHQVPAEQLMDWCPLRLVVPLRAEGDRIVLFTGKRVVRLNEEGTRLYELSSGRRTTRAVIEQAYGELDPGVSLGTFTDQVLAFYADMDEDYAVLFTQI